MDKLVGGIPEGVGFFAAAEEEIEEMSPLTKPWRSVSST